MPHLPAWVHRLRPFAVPIWVVIGILLSIGVYQTLTGKPFDSEVINAPNLMMETISHIYISGISFALVAAIGVPVGVVIAQAGRLVRVPVFLIANLGQAIPGIGLLVLLFAFLGLGVTPTVVALVVYGLLPVLRNTVAGIQGVDPAVVDAARGMGMTRWQVLVRVQTPLASPLIFAGLRTALVLIIGTATLGNFIGGGGLGDVIAAGINNSDRVVFVGAVMVASLALLADWGLSMIERVAVPRTVNG
ncbi:MAG: ABC transporter permease [Candidatus Dormiibacterota bacterium]